MITERVNILGVGVDAIDMPTAVARVGEWVRTRTAAYVCVTSVHGVIESQRSPEVRRIHNGAGMVVPDGMPLVWLSRRLGLRSTERIYGPDLMLAICDESTRAGWRHFFYGGAVGVAELLAEALRKRFPGLHVVGTYTPPFRPLSRQEASHVVARITDSRADIVWVGLSTPKQETWMADFVDRAGGATLIGVGAAFDFLSGAKRQAPRWMRRSGLEWLFRLCWEPKRLWRRYLFNNPYFIGLVLLQLLGLRAYSLSEPAAECVTEGQRHTEGDA